MTITLTPAPAEELRRQLVHQLARVGALRSAPWQQAFGVVPREVFAPEFAIRDRHGLHAYTADTPGWLPAVYSDESLLTVLDENGVAVSSSSQPAVMARMLEHLSVTDGARVLEVGTGTGYNAALLSERLGSDQVVTIDIDPHLTAAARTRLAQVGYAPTVVTGNGLAGWASGGPYDALIATCGIPRIPAAWLAQLRPGGRVVANLGLGIAVLDVRSDGSAQGRFLPVAAAFMTARPTAASPAPGSRPHPAINAPAQWQRAQDLDVDLDGFGPTFLGQLLQPDVDSATVLRDGTPTWCLTDPAGESWARITRGRVEGAGARDLWAEREPLIAAWVGMGEPGADRYSLHVSAAGEHTLAAAGCEWPLP